MQPSGKHKERIMAKLSIVYHSGYGHTKVIADAVARGAASVPGTEVHVVPVADVETHWEDLLASDAIVFGSPTYMGTVSAPFKTFMDATAGIWYERKWQDKLAAGFTNSGSPSGDKLNTLQTLAVFGAQHGMLWVGQAEMRDPSGMNRLGRSPARPIRPRVKPWAVALPWLRNDGAREPEDSFSIGKKKEGRFCPSFFVGVRIDLAAARGGATGGALQAGAIAHQSEVTTLGAGIAGVALFASHLEG
jgi:NAD(P)H dehydrogenase (quinone)